MQMGYSACEVGERIIKTRIAEEHNSETVTTDSSCTHSNEITNVTLMSQS